MSGRKHGAASFCIHCGEERSYEVEEFCPNCGCKGPEKHFLNFIHSTIGSIVESGLAILLSLVAFLSVTLLTGHTFPFSIKVLMSIIILILYGSSIHFFIIYHIEQRILAKHYNKMIEDIELMGSEYRIVKISTWWFKQIIIRDYRGLTLDILAGFILNTVISLAIFLNIWFIAR